MMLCNKIKNRSNPPGHDSDHHASGASVGACPRERSWLSIFSVGKCMFAHHLGPMPRPWQRHHPQARGCRQTWTQTGHPSHHRCPDQHRGRRRKNRRHRPLHQLSKSCVRRPQRRLRRPQAHPRHRHQHRHPHPQAPQPVHRLPRRAAEADAQGPAQAAPTKSGSACR